MWNREQEMPTSACSLPCEVGMIKKQQVIKVLTYIHGYLKVFNIYINVMVLRVILAAGSAIAVRRTSTFMTSLPAETADRDFGLTQISFLVSLSASSTCDGIPFLHLFHWQ